MTIINLSFKSSIVSKTLLLQVGVKPFKILMLPDD